jgi:anti-anti-sigma factor
MMPTREHRSTLRLGRTASGYLVRVEGKGTMRESPSLQEFVERCLDQTESSADFVVDLAGCEYLDSTFLGCLTTLHRRYNRSHPHRFLIAAPAEQCQKLLAPSCLNRFLDILDQSPDPLTEMLETQAREFTSETLGRHVMECHRRLAELGGPREKEFRSIADRLALELGETDRDEEPATEEYQLGSR